MAKEASDFVALGKRLNFLIRELEVEALDLAAYAKPIAEGKFKFHQIDQLNGRFEKWETELSRIRAGLVKMLGEIYDGTDARGTKDSAKRKG
jgi:hypothetical protein